MAAAAGSALQPAAIALLEVASADALAASKPGDWQLVQLSAAAPVRRLQRWACCMLLAGAVSLLLLQRVP